MRPLRTGTVSTYRGVSRVPHEDRVRWRARLCLPGGRRVPLGQYRDEQAAALAHDFAARRQFGDRAVVNFPDRHDAAPPPRARDLPREPVPADRLPIPDPNDPDVCLLPLSSGRVARIDAADADRVSAHVWSWSAAVNRRKGFKNGVAYRGTGPRGRRAALLLSRFILGIVDRKVHVGHADDDTLNCRRGNLVLHNHQQGLWHARKRATPTTSKFKGVSLEKRSCKWRAEITIDGRAKRLGTFRSEHRAAQAYDDAAREHFGSHARINFPDDGEKGIHLCC